MESADGSAIEAAIDSVGDGVHDAYDSEPPTSEKPCRRCRCP
jgi:hypothetical protein